ncbi:transposase [Nocardia wallacei]|uniref:transposase n=1 Tax=Nocardia wallacei TaxID=480035 RepID=UPI002456BC99|nr:transposase [Nocardia wallacei]
MTKRYPPEVREKAVRLVLERLDEFESPYAAARAIGPLVDVHYETLRVWVKKALAQGAPPAGKAGAGLSAAEREELARLRKEVRDLKQANEILKAASAFSRGNSTRDTADRRVHRRIPPGLRRRVDLPCADRAGYPDRAQGLSQGATSTTVGARYRRCSRGERIT